MTKRENRSGQVAFIAGEYGKEKEYWLKKFAGEMQETGFPYDNPVTATGPEEAAKGFAAIPFSNETSEVLVRLSKGKDHRLFIILAAAVAVLLHKYNGTTDITYGAPIFKQEEEGEYINTLLALRNRIEPGETFKNLLLKEIRPVVMEATEHQNYPIETLLFQLNLPAGGHRFPLFDVTLLLENIHHKKHIYQTSPAIIFSFIRKATAPLPSTKPTMSTLSTPSTPTARLRGEIEYKAARYSRETVERIARHFTKLVEQVTANLDTPITTLDILTPEERRQILEEFNKTQRPYPSTRTIDDIFEEKAKENPGQLAVKFQEHTLSYETLSDKSHRLALYLRKRGLNREEPVALIVDNTHKAIIAILA
ncbi:MAG: AMP-binding protein, partial [bacterium]|nr:AMP-binding protein [bacterium]